MKQLGMICIAFLGIATTAWAQLAPIQPTAPVSMSSTDTYCTYSGTVATAYSFTLYLTVIRQDGTAVYGGQWFAAGNGSSPRTFYTPALNSTSWGLAVGNTYRFHAIVQYSPTNRLINDYTVTVVANNGQPDTPVGLMQTPGTAQVSLWWSSAAGATSYNLKRSLISGGPYSTIASPSSPGGYGDNGLANGTYFYVVSAVNSFGEGNDSAECSVTVGPQAGTPSNLLAVATGQSVSLTWTASTGASTYALYRGTSSGGPYTAIPGAGALTTTSYSDTNLTVATRYYYVATATNPSGTSIYSNESSAMVFGLPGGLTATAADGVITLSWSSVVGATSYVISRSTSAGGPFNFLDSSATTTYTDYDVLDGTTYFYSIQASTGTDLGGSSSVVSATPPVAGQKTILFLVGTSPIPANTGDATIQSRISNLGYTVVVKPAGGTGHFTSSDITGKVLIAISATVNPSDVTTNWPGLASATVPILTWQGGLYFPLGMMSGNVLNTDYGVIGGQTQATVYNQDDPIITALTTLGQPVTIMSSSDTFSWAKTNYGSVGAVLPSDPNKVLVFDFETGTTMANGVAPARRVGLFLSTNTAMNLNSTGQALVDSAVQWAVGAPMQLQAVWTSVNSGQVTLHWENSGIATSYSIQRSTSPTGPFSPLVSGITSTSYTDVGLTNGQTYYYLVTALNGVGQSTPSLAVSGVPNPTTIVGVIKGAGFLRRRKAADPVDHWNSRAFTAIVYYNGSQIDPSLLRPTGANPWTIPAGAPASVAAGQTTTGCTVVASNSPNDGAQGTAKLQYAVDVNTGTIQNPNWVSGPSIGVDIQVVPRIQVALRFHFPKDGFWKKTNWFRFGYPNLFEGDAADSTGIRKTERLRFANDLTNLLTFWDQAAMNFYCVNDVQNDLTEIIGKGKGWWVGDNLNVVGKGFLPSRDSFTTLNQIGQKTGVVNVYLIHATSSPKALTQYNYVPDPNNPQGKNPFIVLADGATLAEQAETLCHELGHILGLKEAEDPNNDYFTPNLKGTINNLTPITAYPYSSFLMFSGTNVDTLTLEPEESYVREIAEGAKQGTGNIAQKE